MDAHRRIAGVSGSAGCRRVPLFTACAIAAAHAVLAAGALAAAAPVAESEGRELRRQWDPPPARDDESAEQGADLSALYYDLQIAQDEVRRLHGVVEELNHRIERLEREQRERYIELDQRLLDLRGDGGTVAQGEDGTPAWDTPAVPVTEREAYNVAIGLVNAARPLPRSEQHPQYRKALGMFRDIVKDYPNGEFTANAFYWIGEMHLALGEHEDARAAFAQVDLLYDDHPKVPDALYKLGEVYNVLGDVERSREYMNRVIRDHPGSTAEGLARKYLAELR